MTLLWSNCGAKIKCEKRPAMERFAGSVRETTCGWRLKESSYRNANRPYSLDA